VKAAKSHQTVVGQQLRAFLFAVGRQLKLKLEPD